MSYTPTDNSANIIPTGRIGSHVFCLLSAITITIALVSGAWFASSIIISGSNNTGETDTAVFETPAKMIVIGLVYLIGLVLSSVGIRTLRNSWLPIFIQAYTWLVLTGIVLLEVLIVSRLYQQDYDFWSYIKYLFLFGTGLIALVGLHLVLERHTLFPFGIVIFLVSLGHLYVMVQRYVFSTDVKYIRIFGDLGFLIVTMVVGLVMVSVYKIPTETEAS